jgi:hypothetical protein
MRGFGRLLDVCNHPFLSYIHGNPTRKRHMPNKESHFAVNNRVLRKPFSVNEIALVTPPSSADGSSSLREPLWQTGGTLNFSRVPIKRNKQK